MTRGIQDVSIRDFYVRLADFVAPEIATAVNRRDQGHCMRINDLPESIAMALALRLRDDTDAEVYVIHDSPLDGVGISATKLIERRNSGAKVLVIVPPGTRTAAEDSFGDTTFETLRLVGSVRRLREQVRDEALASAGDVRPILAEVGRHLGGRTGDINEIAFAKYYMTLLLNGVDEETVGAALYQLGLVPDLDLGAGGLDLLPRLTRNLDIAKEFSRPDKTVFEKLQAARLNPHDPGIATFRRSAYDFFSSLASTDRFTWTRQVAFSPQLWSRLTFDKWPLMESTVGEKPELTVHGFKLERNAEGYPRLVLATMHDLALSWETVPPPVQCVNLDHFTVELFQDENPVSSAKNIKRGTSRLAKRSTTLKDLNKQGLEEGLHVVRVTAWSDEGDPLAYEDSEPIFVEIGDDSSDDDSEADKARVEVATSIYHVDLLRRIAATRAGKPYEDVAPMCSWAYTSQRAVGNRTDTYVLRYSSKEAYGIHVNAFLHKLEEQILGEPSDLGLYQLDLRNQTQADNDKVDLQAFSHIDYDHLDEFIAARQALFTEIRRPTTDDAPALVATTDLRVHRALVMRYVSAYRVALENIMSGARAESASEAAMVEANAQLLSIDTLRVRVRRDEEIVLMAPTHPLKVLWFYQYGNLLKEWADDLTRLSADEFNLGALNRALGAVGSLNMPAFLPIVDHAPLVNLDQFDFSWSLFVAADTDDPRALISGLRAALGARAGDTALTTIGSDQLAAKLRQYLVQHPYVTTLVLNVVHPGSGEILVDALLRLEREFRGQRSLRFLVRLLSDDGDRDRLGAALNDLMSQDALSGNRNADEVDEFLTASANPLFPKLAFSKHRIDELLDNPSSFDSHVTLLLDFFAGEVSTTVPDANAKSSFLHGILQELATKYRVQDGTGTAIWERYLSTNPAYDLPEVPGMAAEIAALATAHQRIAAQLLGLGEGVPCSRLSLDPVRASVLNQVHQLSDWVVIVDRNFGVEYLDSPDTAGGPAYLIDYTPEGVVEAGHRMITSTGRVDEIRALVRPILHELDLPEADGPVDLMLEALKSISGRLVLQFLSAGSQMREVLGLAIARLFLRQSSLLSDMFIVPVDAHQQLFANAVSEGSSTTHSRSDLILVEPATTERELVFHLVEVKMRQEVGGNFLASPLRTHVDKQLENTEKVLRSQFGGATSGQERFDSALKTKQLYSLMRFYLDRARRYGLIAPKAAADAEHLLRSLEEGYAIGFTRNAVIIDLSSEDYERVEADGVIYHLLGRQLVAQLTDEPAEHQIEAIDVPTNNLLTPTRESFRRQRTTHRSRIVVAPITTPTQRIEPEPEVLVHEPAEEETAEVTNGEMEAPASSLAVKYDVLLGAQHRMRQYGVIGRQNEHVVALDLNGTQTLSLFGVQGSGKSYTLGSIVEMATRPLPGISELPQPLASVIFHYSSDQTYKPEFVSMCQPNAASGEIEMLRQMYGAVPAALPDVLILTPEGKVADRREEFPHLTVEPILFHPDELSADDWFFLMGAVGNESLYIKKMRQVFRGLRGNLTLNALYGGIAGANLNDAQYQLAKSRVDFAKEFISENRRLSEHIRPGRLVIVDVRDPFLERAEVLALFVVMLRVIASARTEDTPFNKLIVFDEAHKYMAEKDLTGVVVEAIREMRHKGVSVLIASQDPLSVPTEVIELSTQIILHQFNSPAWLRHVQKAATALQSLNPGRLNMLKPGEAYLWSSKATDPLFERQAVKIQMRPRATRHGGETRLAAK